MEEKINKTEQLLCMQVAQLKDSLKNKLNELDAIDNLCTKYGIPKSKAVEISEPGINTLLKTYARVRLLIKMLENKT